MLSTQKLPLKLSGNPCIIRSIVELGNFDCGGWCNLETQSHAPQIIIEEWSSTINYITI